MIDTEDFFSNIPQSVLIVGANVEMINNFVENWSARLLETDREGLKKHPDFYAIYPQGKMRKITVDALRELKRNVYTTSQRGGRKVFAIYEADRLNAPAANALLKTLEEPTESSSIFLVTRRPYELLPTLRSRCWWIHLHQESYEIHDPDLENWLDDLAEFLAHLAIKKNKSSVLEAYGLIYRIQNYITQKSTQLGVKGDETLTEEEQAAQTAQAEKQIIQDIFHSMEVVCSEVAENYPEFRRKFPDAIRLLERCFSRTEVNLGPLSAVEAFLLAFCYPMMVQK